VEASLEEADSIAFDEIDEAMFLGDSTRPKAGIKILQ
jgi:hypothetical protein